MNITVFMYHIDVYLVFFSLTYILVQHISIQQQLSNKRDLTIYSTTNNESSDSLPILPSNQLKHDNGSISIESGAEVVRGICGTTF